jgi:hypothetical protein
MHGETVKFESVMWFGEFSLTVLEDVLSRLKDIAFHTVEYKFYFEHLRYI